MVAAAVALARKDREGGGVAEGRAPKARVVIGSAAAPMLKPWKAVQQWQ